MTDIDELKEKLRGCRVKCSLGESYDWLSSAATPALLDETAAAIDTLQAEVSNLRRQVEGLIAAIEFEVPPIRDGVDVDSRLSILMECAKEARSSGGLSQ